MADRYGVNLGNVLSAAEDIRRARIENKFRPRSLELAQQGAETGNALEEIRLQEAERGYRDETTMRNARGVGARAAGLPAQEVAMATISPSQAQEFKTYFDNLEESDRKKLEQSVDEMGRAAAYVKASEDPEKAYLQIKGMLPKEIQAQMPATYDPDWIDASLAQATEIEDMIATFSKEAPLRELSSADSNAIRAATKDIFGGFVNPLTGETDPLDKETGQAILAVSERAAEIFQANKELGHAQAVKQAFEELKAKGVVGGEGEGAGTSEPGDEFDLGL
jgi:hypothetical protein